MKFNSWKYLYPPRPECAIAPDTLVFYENMKWVAQFKKNGTCTILGISPDKKNKEIIAMTRHNEDHKAWSLTQHIKDELIRLFPEKKWAVLVAEVMHNKTPDIKDTIFIHDIIVYKNEYLVGSKFIDRQKILDQHLVTNVETKTHYVCDSKGKIWYAKRFEKGFKDLFWSIKNSKVDEGLVLKDPNGSLNACDKLDANRQWQVKCRHATKNLPF